MTKRKKSSAEKKADREKRRRRRSARDGETANDITDFLKLVESIEGQGRDLPRGAVEALGTLFSTLGEWNNLGSPSYRKVASRLASLDPTFAVAVAGGLLTDPEFQTAKARLEVFLHLVAAHARGERHLSLPLLRQCLETDFTQLPIRRMEDPPEDVFISNVVATGGNYRIFEGSWESADKSLQAVLEALFHPSLSNRLPGLAGEIISLLRLSDTVARRAGLQRWAMGESDIPTDTFLTERVDLDVLASRTSFTWSDLGELRIDPSGLTPFAITITQATAIRQQILGNTNLERRPLLVTDDSVILSYPSAVSPAIRRYVVERCAAQGLLKELARALRHRNSHVLFGRALPRVDAPKHVAERAMSALSLSESGDPAWDEVVCAFDVDKYAIVILLPDDLISVEETGLTAPGFDQSTVERMVAHAQSFASQISKNANGGLVLIVFDGIGRGIALGLPEFPPRWHAVVISGPHFETFADSPEASLLRLWKLRQQMEEAQDRNVAVHESNGVLNTYAFWQAQNYRLVPLNIPFPSEHPNEIMMGIEFIKDVRVTERREHDPHAVLLAPGGAAVAVRRYARTAFFPAMLRRPLYAAEGYAAVGQLAGVYEGQNVVVWLRAERPKEGGTAAEMTLRIWEALLSWLDRLVPVLIEQHMLTPTSNIAHLHIELQRPAEWDLRADLMPEGPQLSLDIPGSAAHLSIPVGFTRFLMRASNDGERVLLELVAESLIRVLGQQAVVEPEAIKNAVRVTMKDANTRFIHLFNATAPTDVIGATNPRSVHRPRLLQREDFSAAARGLAWKVIDQRRGTFAALGQRSTPTVTCDAHPEEADLMLLRGTDNCLALYRSLVDALWVEIKCRLEGINGVSLLETILQNLEWIHADRQQWRRTARALTSLYGDVDDVTSISASRESERAGASSWGRVLAEMAICTCPMVGGRPVSYEDLDALVAAVSVLMHLAYDSDAIHGGFAEPEIRIYPNGEIEINLERIEKITRPFVLDAHAAEFRAAADSYDALFSDAALEPERTKTEAYTDSDFVSAFQAEFGISPGRVLNAVAELANMGVERAELLIRTTKGELTNRLKKALGYTDDEIMGVLALLALVPRKRWDYAPPGFLKRDWEPWRFRRRLSLATRPLVILGDADASEVLYGLHHLGSSVTYLLDNIHSAWFPDEFFHSEAMRTYRGVVAHRKGLEFGEDVSQELKKLNWRTRTQLTMTTLGGSQELGDIDVLAWSANEPRVLLVECKRLQPARTIGEIVDVLREFQGNAGDSLDRHLRRTKWLHDNPRGLFEIIGREVTSSALVPVLVTNRFVPMRYRDDLPLPPNQIVPFDLLATFVTSD
jgi:hypothetical protein